MKTKRITLPIGVKFLTAFVNGDEASLTAEDRQLVSNAIEKYGLCFNVFAPSDSEVASFKRCSISGLLDDCFDCEVEVLVGFTSKGKMHTPGPWAVEKNAFFDIRSSGRSIVIHDSELSNNSDEDLANARLIAAAPEMLEALELIEKTLLEKHQGIENHTFELGLISDTLKKAKGES